MRSVTCLVLVLLLVGALSLTGFAWIGVAPAGGAVPAVSDGRLFADINACHAAGSWTLVALGLVNWCSVAGVDLRSYINLDPFLSEEAIHDIVTFFVGHHHHYASGIGEYIEDNPVPGSFVEARGGRWRNYMKIGPDLYIHRLADSIGDYKEYYGGSRNALRDNAGAFRDAASRALDVIPPLKEFCKVSFTNIPWPSEQVTQDFVAKYPLLVDLWPPGTNLVEVVWD